MTDDGGMLESAEQIQPIFLKVVTAMAMVDGKLKFSEIDGINAVFERHAGRPLKQWEIDEIALSDHVDDVPLPAYLAGLAGRLGDKIKDELILAALHIAGADELDIKETALLTEMAAALNISEERLQALVG
ncbi:MAG: hypothetical protein A3G18_12445 [Rhodospirillales bacterium RIFCSPLOWO2_12_FULL_58_28]|nr:MAG: hypothetical protein A3H92_12460 [Rhodospirillales bacterium RIFCSPLOWO2_02_FULL_58_16]OHC79670.1 MAG: hypothetical protein A3G18_12445 [Rhodospirillales bacterium RIFCSPLOWO2_12_FULL_58_28]